MSKAQSSFFIATLSLLFVCILFFLSRPLGHTQEPPQVSPPTLLYPDNGTLMRFPGENAKIFFAWTETEEADSYEINVLVGNRPAAQKRTDKTEIELNLGLTVRDAQERVRWTVRAFIDDQAGPISDIFSFKFGNQEGTPFPGTPMPTPNPSPTPTVLPPPVLLQPQDGQEFNAIEGLQGIEFDWETITGATSYEFQVFLDNEVVVRKDIEEPPHTEVFTMPIQKVYQWNVLGINSVGVPSSPGVRYSFRIGADTYPTPTPMPISTDLNRNGKFDAEDVYFYAARYATNDPLVDFNHDGLNDAKDLLHFLKMYRD